MATVEPYSLANGQRCYLVRHRTLNRRTTEKSRSTTKKTAQKWAATVEVYKMMEQPVKFTDLFPTPTGSLEEKQSEWQRRPAIARETFQDKVDPNMVVDPGTDVRRLLFDHKAADNGDD